MLSDKDTFLERTIVLYLGGFVTCCYTLVPQTIYVSTDPEVCI